MMNSDTERRLESAFDRLAREIELPPEERWLPRTRPRERRSSWATVLVAAALIGALAFSIRAVREPGAAVAPPSAEAQAWQRVVADAPLWVPVLRPSWLPARVLDSSARCGTPVTGAFSHPAGAIEDVRAGVASYAVDYHPQTGDEACPRVRFTMQVEVLDGAPVAGIAAGRRSNETLISELPVLGSTGQIVRVNENAAELRFILSRGPYVYRISAIGLTQEDLARIAGSLEVSQR